MIYVTTLIVFVTVESRTRWTQHDNDTRLDVRTSDIKNWIDTLAKTLHDTEEEIDKVSNLPFCQNFWSIFFVLLVRTDIAALYATAI